MKKFEVKLTGTAEVKATVNVRANDREELKALLENDDFLHGILSSMEIEWVITRRPKYAGDLLDEEIGNVKKKLQVSLDFA